MSTKTNATCKICGKKYYACLSCADAMKVSPYKAYTDTPDCFKVYQVLRGYSTDVYTKVEAKEKLENIKLMDVESFRPHIKKIVKDILKEEKAVVETVEKIENEVVKDVVKVEKTNDIVRPTTFRKKFNNKMESR